MAKKRSAKKQPEALSATIRRTLAAAQPTSGAELIARRIAGRCIRCGDPHPGIEPDLLPSLLCAECQQAEDEARRKAKRRSRSPKASERATAIDAAIDAWGEGESEKERPQ